MSVISARGCISRLHLDSVRCSGALDQKIFFSSVSSIKISDPSCTCLIDDGAKFPVKQEMCQHIKPCHRTGEGGH